jgi:hypothetical protein
MQFTSMKNNLICVMAFTILNVLQEHSIAQCVPERYLKRIFASARTHEHVIYNRALALQGACLVETNTDTVAYMLDVYEPVGDTLLYRPCIVYAHGGAFLIGDRRMIPIDSFCYKMAMYGYVVVSIDYRKCFNVASTNAAVRAVYRAVQDMKAAIRYVKGNAQWLRIDTNMIFAAGNSAGSIMAIHAAYADEQERAMLPATYSQPDLGCLECSGNNFTGIGKPQAVLNFWGAIADTAIIHAGDVPLFSVHGSADNMVFPEYASPFSYPAFPPMYGSAPIHRRLNNVGVVNEFHYLIGLPHEPWLFTSPLYVDTFSLWASEFLYRELLKPRPEIIAANTACTRDTFTYAAPFHEGSYYCWNVQGGVIVSQVANEIKVIWHTPGTGIIALIEKNLYDAVSDKVEKQITVYAKPFAHAGNDQSICMNDSARLSGSGGTQYLWMPYNYINGATTATPVVFPKASQSYILRVSDGYCYDYDTIHITVHPLPELTTKGDISICRGDTGMIEAVTAESVIWQPASGLENPQAPVTAAFPQHTTLYTVTATDNNQCSVSDTVKVLVRDKPPVPEINAYQNLLITTSGYTYQWYLNDSLLEHFTQNIIQASSSGYYRVVITNQYQCSASSAYFFYDTPAGNEWKTNDNHDFKIFPNPCNDKLVIQNSINHILFTVSIFDMSGSLVYRSENAPFQKELTIDITGLPPSMYLLYIHSDDMRYWRKIITY